MNIFLDIETIPQQSESETKAEIASTIKHPVQMKKPETISAWHNGEGSYAGVKEALIDDTYRKTSLDGAKGQICSIAYAFEDNDPIAWAQEEGVDEETLLLEFSDQLRADLTGRPPFFIGHYISGFDLAFLWKRCVINRVIPGFKIPHIGRHDKDYFDTMIAWAGYKDRISQDALCQALGIEGKPDGIDGSKVWDFFKEGRIEEIKAYNIDDVLKVRKIYNRIAS